jgi:hypothetical protein
VSRAPTHEPYPYHNKGVDVEIEFEEGKPSPPPGAVPVPEPFCLFSALATTIKGVVPGAAGV